MNRCETIEECLSATIDGEVDTAGVALAIDHLLDCASCRDFWARARALDRLVLGRPSERSVGPVPDALWERIAAAARPGSARRGAGWRRWGSAAAAVLVLSLGLWWMLERRPAPRVAAGAAEVEVVLGDESGRMSDERFVQLTTELLRADGRYRRKMREVMELVTDETSGLEGSVDRPGVLRAEDDHGAPSEGAGDRSAAVAAGPPA